MATPEELAELWRLLTGPLPQRARRERAISFDDTRRWMDPNGYRLADRLWNQRQEVRRRIDDRIRLAISRGEDALTVAKEVEQYLDPAYAPRRTIRGRVIRDGRPGVVTAMPRSGTGSAPARTLMRTEVTRAHGQATIRTADAIGALVRWAISGRHPRPDECDDNASRDHGFGPGVYRPQDVPRYPSHPNCICSLSPQIIESDAELVRRFRREFGLGDDPPPEPVPLHPSTESRVTHALPVSRSLQLSPDLVQGPVARALQLIDDVHRDGNLPTIPLSDVQDSISLGAFFFHTGGPARRIDVRLFANPMPEWTAVHEIGHFLDYAGMGPSSTAFLSSSDSSIMAGWRVALDGSDAVRQLREATRTGIIKGQPAHVGYLNYLLDPEELWARSYTQFIATRTADAQLQTQLNSLRSPDRYPEQWSDGDFGPIADAIEALFRRLGWIV